MTDLERKSYWAEVPKRRKGWVVIEVGEETGERLNSLINYLRTFGTSVVASKGDEMRGMPATPFLAKASVEEESDLALSVSLPEWPLVSEISSVRVSGSGLPSTFRSISVELGWKGDTLIGLRSVHGLVDLAKSPRVSSGIKDWLRRLLEAEEVQVEIGQFVFANYPSARRTWRVLEKEVFSSSSD